MQLGYRVAMESRGMFVIPAVRCNPALECRYSRIGWGLTEPFRVRVNADFRVWGRSVPNSRHMSQSELGLGILNF